MKNKKLYVVGFIGDSQTALYSKDAWAFDDEKGGKYGGISKMTLPQAKKHLNNLCGDKKAIFKVVAVYKERSKK